MANIKLSDPIDTYTRMTFEKLKMYVAKNVGSFVANEMEVRNYVELALEGMVYELHTSVLASKIADDSYKAHFYYKVPTTWFQQFKKEHAPKWFIRRYPIHYTSKSMTKTVNFTRYETYPKANIAVPKDQRTVEIMGLERPLRDVIEEY